MLLRPRKLTSKITQDSELLVAQNEATEFTIVRNIELEEAKVVGAKIISMKSAKVKKFKNDILIRRREEKGIFKFKNKNKCESVMFQNRTIEFTKNARAHRIMIRKAKRCEKRKIKTAKARANRILIRKAMRSAKVIEFKNKILLNRRVMTRNMKRNEVRKQMSAGIISRIKTTTELRRAIRSERVIKMNRKRKRESISLDKIATAVKRRASRLYLKTKKEGNSMNSYFAFLSIIGYNYKNLLND